MTGQEKGHLLLQVTA